MAKRLSPKSTQNEKVHIEVESWQWESSSPRPLWKYWLAFATLLAVGILFAFGFLILAAFALIIAILINLVLFLFKKLT